MSQENPQNPITKAHFEGVKKFEEDFLVEKWPSGYEWGVAPDPAMVIAFLTTYGTNLLKAAKEAGPGKEKPWGNPDNEFQRGYDAGHEVCRTSFHSAIDEGIKEIRNN